MLHIAQHTGVCLGRVV
ncbi:hypothetical protein F383_35406 [Gossypium arboreum]|uniref:Uncharacterized protein n=1 Tax=Gossypium arboreum TaxID=29729 RepID=A0A0B0N545_GOSAR|nr:hypothetical protein F383_35406 [Gossypium arboreum]